MRPPTASPTGNPMASPTAGPMGSGGAVAAGRRRVLVAGVGNVFLGDDGFGVEVVSRIDAAALPASVRVRDYGIRGVHLAYELLDDPPDTLILVDAAPVCGPAGTVAVLEVERAAPRGEGTSAVDGHGMDPRAVLDLLGRLGGDVRRVLVVGCRPQLLDEHMGLSAPVAAAVDAAVALVVELAAREAAGEPASETARGPLSVTAREPAPKTGRPAAPDSRPPVSAPAEAGGRSAAAEPRGDRGERGDRGDRGDRGERWAHA